MAQSKILIEAKVLGINPKITVTDNSNRDIPEDKRPKVDVIPVTFLKNIDGIGADCGYLGQNIDVLKYNIPAADKDILKHIKPQADLLLEVNQTVFEFGKDAGKISEKVVGVRSLIPVK